MDILFLGMLGVASLLLLALRGLFKTQRQIDRLEAELDHLPEREPEGVPPFAISLQSDPTPVARKNEPLVDGIGRQFELSGYRSLARFRIPELPDLRLCVLAHPDTHSYALIYDHDSAGVDASVCVFFADDTMLTITSAPETGLEYPQQFRYQHLAVNLTDPLGPRALHEALASSGGDMARFPATLENFTAGFVAAYALEMEWRIASGGPSSEELRREAHARGQRAPKPAAIAAVQRNWQLAITRHKRALIEEAFVESTPMSRQEWQEKRERLRIVGDWDAPEELAEALAWALLDAESESEVGVNAEVEATEAQRHAAACERFLALFSGRSPRAAFADAQEQLPEKVRFELLARFEDPSGDVYLEREN